jgi:multimeric flavodoxin WrbA
MPLKALALNCSLKREGESSSTDRLLKEVLEALAQHDAKGEIVRIAAFDIKPGVTADEGEGDEWPGLLRQILDTDILVLGTPIWLGQPSSVAKRVLERMDAFFGEPDGSKRLPPFGKVAIVAVVGNEDGAHHVCAELYQALNDVGFTIPASGGTYWVGEAMGKVNYQDLGKTPDKVAANTQMLASNAAHLARLLKSNRYPGVAAQGSRG